MKLKTLVIALLSFTPPFVCMIAPSVNETAKADEINWRDSAMIYKNTYYALLDTLDKRCLIVNKKDKKLVNLIEKVNPKTVYKK